MHPSIRRSTLVRAAFCGTVAVLGLDSASAQCPPGNVLATRTETATLPGVIPFQPRVPLPVPRFLPLPGQSLQRVDVHLRVTQSALTQIENTGPVPCTSQWNANAQVRVMMPFLPRVEVPVGQSGMDMLAPFDGVLDFAGPSGRTMMGVADNLVVAPPIVSPLALSAFTGPGTVLFLVSSMASFFNNGDCGNFTTFSDQDLRLEVRITYTYCTPAAAPVCPVGIAVDLWPPNHTYAALDLAQVAQVSDPNSLPLTLQVTSITQDEPVDASGGGDGNTTCDGRGIGTSIASVRAERQGGGNGRVYRVQYTATNSAGAMCPGSFLVRVPHSQNGATAVDDGQAHASNQGCP